MPNREGILNLADWACEPENAAHIGYSDQRPMDISPRQEALIEEFETVAPNIITINWDCTAFVDWLFLHSGSKCPTSGTAIFNGIGNTETIAAVCTTHYTNTLDCKTGAIGIYGLNFPLDLARQHAIVYLEADGQPENPWVASHGSAAGPLRLRLEDENGAHPGASFTWVSVGNL